MNFGIAHINIQQPPKEKKKNESTKLNTTEHEETEESHEVQQEHNSQEDLKYLKARQENKLTPNQLASEQEFGQFECALTDPQQQLADEEVKHTTQSSILDIDN